MARSIDETLLPRPPQPLDAPAIAQATRRAAERLEEEFRLSPEAAEALAAAVVDPAEIRKAAENPERLYVPGGTLLGLRTRVWARRVMPDPRNPRVGPVRRHPVAESPGSTEDSRFRPIPDPEPDAGGRPQLLLRVANREHLSWASVIAKKYILKDNDWRLSIRNQGVMTEVWLSAVTLVHDDGTAVSVPVTSEGSSRLTACHDILDIRSADVPYSRDDRALRSIIRSLNDAHANGASVEQSESLRCETIPALLLVGFEPNPGQTTATFATAVRSLVALRHVDPPKAWDEAAKMESIADAVLEALTAEGLITPREQLWLIGALTPEEAVREHFSADPAVRAARIVQLLTDSDTSVHHAVRMAITSQSTRQRVRNKFKLEVAAALIMRSVAATGGTEKVTDIHRALRAGFSDTLASESWRATYRPTDELVKAALDETANGGGPGPSSLELAARAAYPLVVSRQLFSDRGTKNNDQVDRRDPGSVIDRMRTNPWGVRQLGQALDDHSAGAKIRAVAADGSPIVVEDGLGEQQVSDNWLRRTFPPPGRPAAPAAPETAHERLLEALSVFGQAMEALSKAGRDLAAVEGLGGRHLIDTEGINPADADIWWNELMRVAQQLPVWKAIHLAKQGQSNDLAKPWGVTGDPDERDGEFDADDLSDADDAHDADDPDDAHDGDDPHDAEDAQHVAIQQ